MRFRPVIFAWCLLLGGTLAMAVAAWWLLGREADRVESLAAGTLANRTAAVADSIDLLMEAIRTGVAEWLTAAGEASEPRVALAELIANNPYLVAGFYFREADGVTMWYGERGDLPAPASISVRDGDVGIYPWSLPELEAPSPAPVAQASEAQILTELSAPSDAYESPSGAAPARPNASLAAVEARQEAPQKKQVMQNVALKEQRAAVRQLNLGSSFSRSDSVEADQQPELRELSVDDVANVDGFADTKAKVAPPLFEGRSAWARSIVGKEEEWVFWAELRGVGGYLGVWLDRAALLAELEKAVILSEQDGLHFGLVDSLGVTVAGAPLNRYPKQVERSADLVLAVGNTLPGWAVESFRATDLNTFGQSFRWVGGLFIVGLSFAVVLGSVVLIWQGRRDALEAERKTTFVANVSHELKTPLTSIRLFADMLHSGRVKDAAKQQAYLQTMLHETQRLTRLVNNVLDFSRLDRGLRSGEVVRVDLKETLAHLIESNRARIEAEGLALEAHLPEAALDATLDVDALEQILINLLDNAVKYAASGERIEVQLKAESNGWSVAVCDFGPGIPARERKRVFGAFHRLDDRLTSERPGCGLGLSIAARLSEEMGGRLSLGGNVPQGCRFTLQVGPKN